MNHLTPRKRNITSISYILIARESPMTSPILAPEAFRENEVIKFIRNCPEDILQFITPLDYFQYSMLLDIGGYDFRAKLKTFIMSFKKLPMNSHITVSFQALKFILLEFRMK
jgi:hypothetical protein